MHVISAIFRRNFVSYFSNPTGYVFICVFTLLSGAATLGLPAFWNAKLANLDQLNAWFPWIMLIFVPAITMSIWAEERRQGTDELLLTIPATDFQVVMGKYLSAVAIFTVGLLFSLICNLLVLKGLGNPDLGQYLATYFGYWLIGVMMLAIGTSASFLTKNITVAYVLGALFNLPLVILVMADFVPFIGGALRSWSVAERFGDFGRGVVSVSGLSYFLGFTALGLYLCMVLIGRRHWLGGRDGESLIVHFLVRAVAIIAIVIGVNVFFLNRDPIRADISSEGLSSLSRSTVDLLKKLNPKQAVRIEAYISPAAETPESYQTTRLNLLSTLQEIRAAAGDKVVLKINDVPRISDDMVRAEAQGIKSVKVTNTVGGVRRQDEDEMVLGLKFHCGRSNLTVPFVGKSLPVEYEIMRSVLSVSQQTKKKLGIVTTDVRIDGGGDNDGSTKVTDELKKQYEVITIDPNQPITQKIDVLVALQPSSLSPPAFDNFMAAVRTGIPTAVFEDPFSFIYGVPGTDQPKTPPQNNPFQPPQPPQPKGNIKALWDLLEVDFVGGDVVWQDYDAKPKLPLPGGKLWRREWLYAGPGSGEPNAFNPNDVVSSNLQLLLFPFGGAVSHRVNAKETEFTKLVTTSKNTGTVPAGQILERRPFMGERPNPRLGELEVPTHDHYVIAARIRGKSAPVNPKMSDKDFVGASQIAQADPGAKGTDKKSDAKGSEKDAEKPAEEKIAGDGKLNVILVADIDLFSQPFFDIRNRGQEFFEEGAELDVDNVTFVLNVLDSLAGDDRLIEIRKRRRIYRTLTKIEEQIAAGDEEADKIRKTARKTFEDSLKTEQTKLDTAVKEITENKALPEDVREYRIMSAQQNGERNLAIARAKLEQDRDEKIRQAENLRKLQIRNIQDRYKLWAILLPLLLPLGLAIVVFFVRKSGETEGVAAGRLR